AVVELLGGLGQVAEVGEEQPLVARSHECEAVRAAEAGQPPHVDEVGHQQRVELALGELGGDAVGTVHRSHSPSSSLMRVNAVRYPSTPSPLTVATQRSRMTETRRNSSRASTSERCTSTVGSAAISSASRMAQE